MAIELRTLPQTPTDQLVTAGFTCKETPIREVSNEGTDVGRKRECTKEGFLPTSGAELKRAGDAELAYSDDVREIYRKESGVENRTEADIAWKGVAHIAGIDWDVTVGDRGSNGTIDVFTLVKPTTRANNYPSATYVLATLESGGVSGAKRSRCWVLDERICRVLVQMHVHKVCTKPLMRPIRRPSFALD